MQNYKASILSTQTIDRSLVKKAGDNNIALDIVSFIKTEAVQSVEVHQEIETAAGEYATIVFTSKNAVEAVISMLDDSIPKWRIYCIENKTKQAVAAYFGESSIEYTAPNAAALAQKIIDNGDDEEIIFFCGNHRRDELPSQLRKHEIDVLEIVVYETIATPKKTAKAYNAVLFFSSGAVESFFSVNTLTENCIAFAIGNTTHQTIKKYCNNTIIVAETPDKTKLVEKAIDECSEAIGVRREA